MLIFYTRSRCFLVTDKAGSLQDIINMAAQLATTASVGASVVGQIVSGLQSMGLFR